MLRRTLTLVVLASLALLLGAAPAWAHSQLEKSDPAEGASLATPPRQVSLTFSEPVQVGFSVITIVGPDGKDYRAGAITEVNDTVTVAAQPLGPAGVYQIGYRVVSADGHPVSGQTSFTLTAPGAGTPAPTSSAASATPAAPATSAPVVPAAAPTEDGGGPVWPWIVGAVVLVGIAVAAALRLGRAS